MRKVQYSCQLETLAAQRLAGRSNPVEELVLDKPHKGRTIVLCGSAHGSNDEVDVWSYVSNGHDRIFIGVSRNVRYGYVGCTRWVFRDVPASDVKEVCLQPTSDVFFQSEEELVEILGSNWESYTTWFIAHTVRNLGLLD
jgi:hypothetical protein